MSNTLAYNFVFIPTIAIPERSLIHTRGFVKRDIADEVEIILLKIASDYTADFNIIYPSVTRVVHAKPKN